MGNHAPLEPWILKSLQGRTKMAQAAQSRQEDVLMGLEVHRAVLEAQPGGLGFRGWGV